MAIVKNVAAIVLLGVAYFTMFVLPVTYGMISFLLFGSN